MSAPAKLFLLILSLLVLAMAAWWFPAVLVNKSTPEKHFSPASIKLVILTPHWDGLRNEFRRGFDEWYHRTTGKTADIEYLAPGGTSDCVRYVFSEFKRNPGGINIDLFFGGGLDPFLEMKRQNVLAPVKVNAAVLAAIPRVFGGCEIYVSAGYWFGAALSGFGIVYNKWVVNRMHFVSPRQWADLAAPGYYSWIGAADPRDSGTMHLMFELMLQVYGWQDGWRIISCIAANTRSFTKGANDVPKMVARGDVAFGLAIDFYGWAEVAEAGADKIGMVLPENQTIISPDAIAMLRGAPHPQLARAFIEYVLSEEGQRLWFLRKGEAGGPQAQELNRMPVRPDFYARYAGRTNVQSNPFAKAPTFIFDHALAGKRWAIINDLFGVACIDHGTELKKAWRASMNKNRDSLWIGMPITQAQCLDLAAKQWQNAVEKNRIIGQWHDFFINKYKKLSDLNRK
ncbi:MAG: extracellular solute-binding protein [Chitinivibrionales bacterium]|nr:extracellular solute-binding protein [Chitinivibrionales bacterium]